MPTDAPVLPELRDRTIVITGANAGLGYFSAEQLARAGARVILACRNEGRADAAVQTLRREVPDARLDVVRVDVADLASVESAARQLASETVGIDAIIANAGLTVAGVKGRQTTADGFELLFGGNYLGHFALVAHLFPLLREHARVVTVGSIMHRWSPLELDDLHAERGYRAATQYGRSKTALMSFALELDRRCRRAKRPILGLAAHPGFALDSLAPTRANVNEVSVHARLFAQPSRVLCQGKDAGAWPLVHAAAGADIEGGQYWGPGGWQGLSGAPALTRMRAHASDPGLAGQLWARSEELTGVPFDIAAAP